MSFFATLERETAIDRQDLLAIPFVESAVGGRLSRSAYLGFLAQAYHHVRHTVPLLHATIEALPESHAPLRDAMGRYVDEEQGHDEWILSDIRLAGGDAEAVRRSQAGIPCDVLVAYAYDVIHRRNPVGFLGMVHVLEGTSVRAATAAARALKRSLGLPPDAFTYLTTHGDLDQEHVRFFEGLVDSLAEESDRSFVLHTSHVFFRLYGDVLRALPSR